MKYLNKITSDIIECEIYSQLSDNDKNQYIPMKEDETPLHDNSYHKYMYEREEKEIDGLVDFYKNKKNI